VTATRRPSIDLFRGLDVLLLLLVEWVLPSPAYSWLRHSPWNGVRVADVVFPAFLFLVGASAAAGRPRPLSGGLRRALTLVVLGLLFNAWGDSGADLSHLRIPGVLQMIGIAGLLGAVAVSLARHRTGIVAASAFALVGVHAVLLAHAPLACGTGRLDKGCSLPWAVDRHVFGLAHVYHRGAFGHDPEGLVTAVFGATAIVLFGWVAGRLLDDRRASGLLVAATLAGAGLAALVFPPNKRLWTPTFGLLLAAGCTLVLVALSALLDGREARRPQPLRWTITAVGRNALLVYVGQHVVLGALESTPARHGNLATALQDHVGSLLGVAVLAVVAWTALAAALHAADWHVTL
jgi:heparan-alpha-glucosaminide N-acetyltransferase